jgi:hypothetical protein
VAIAVLADEYKWRAAKAKKRHRRGDVKIRRWAHGMDVQGLIHAAAEG